MNGNDIRGDVERLRQIVPVTGGYPQAGSDASELWELKELNTFDTMLAHISTRLISATPDRVDSIIEQALEEIMQFFEADRCGVLEVQEEGDCARVTHAAYGEGVERVPVDVNVASLFPWACGRLMKQGEVVAVTRPSQLPPEADRDRKSCQEFGIYSSLTVPLTVSGRTARLITINTRRDERVWGYEHVARLRLLGEICANSLERTREGLELKELRQQFERESNYLREEIKVHFQHENIIGKTDGLKKVLAQVEQVAPTDATVLVLGETGTGKDLIAQCIHQLSRQKGRPMVKVNCASIPGALIESELFGREKGAYTGALTRQKGRFEIAAGSTIFLDEIGELPLELQAKLLRVLQDGEFERLGDPHTIRINVRVIAATNRDLSEAVHNGTFREDLYYRLNVFPVHIPPLRERIEDIPMLVMALLNEFCVQMGKKIKVVDRKTMDALQRYSWPGNIRELRNVIERAVIISNGPRLSIKVPQSPTELHPLDRSFRDTQYRHILEVLEATRWRIKGPGGAAEILGLRPSTLYTKMESLNIPTRHEKAGAGNRED